jgi:hypothetical protein
VLRRLDQSPRRKEAVLRKDAVDGATECGAHFCVAGLVVEPAFKETPDDSVAHHKLPNTGADGFYHARTVGERHWRKLLTRVGSVLKAG